MRPMLATPGSLPSGPDWTFECKWDGMRLLATVTDELRLLTRNGNDASARFPELSSMVDWIATSEHERLVLDGELIAADGSALPSFSLLAHRIHRNRPDQATGADIPVTYVVFDLLGRDDTDLRPLTYVERRRHLEQLQLECEHVVVGETFTDGPALFRATAEQGLEGVVAKRNGSRYQSGVRSRDWIKIPHRETHEYVVVGWRPERSGTGRVGSLALAVADGSDWRFTGAAGSGLTQALSDALAPVLDEITIAQAPTGLPPDFTPVAPHLVVEVAHLGHSAEGLLRHPAIVRLRPDLTPTDLASDPGTGPSSEPQGGA
ncbi:MAG: DNA ligase [Actinobacteria bacterium]|nr:DNA ligase [Actinomycetota bacterium]